MGIDSIFLVICGALFLLLYLISYPEKKKKKKSYKSLF